MTKVSENGVEKASYEYDELNQLVRENNKYLNKTFFYTYDKGGNLIRTDWTYYSTLDQVPFMTLNTYHYGDTNWKDKLTSFNDQTITYDEIGNPLTYRDGWNFTWENGRKLATAEKSGYTVSYEYNADGLRTEKTVNGETTKYYYKGSQLLGEERDGTTLYYYYDSTGQLIGLNYNGVNYYALRNLQGDVVALTDKNGTKVVSYVYDSWGRVISVTGSLKDTLGKDNPFRYRGYYYDEETGFYYLQSRYYDPETCRFLNADSKINSSAGLVGTNVYAYCLNNPIRFVDLNGEYPGQLFDTMDEAARDFAYFINSKSIQNNREYSTSFYIREYTFTVTHYRYKKIMGVSVPVPYTVTWHLRGYTYTDPVAGNDFNSPVPNKPGQLGIGHSHGAYQPQSPDTTGIHNDAFSYDDIRVANSFRDPTISYLITPAGILRKYDPQTQVDEEIFPTENFPYDPKHPAVRK